MNIQSLWNSFKKVLLPGEEGERKEGSVRRASVILAGVFLLCALLSVLIPGRHFASPDSYVKSVQELNETKSGVEKLAASAAAASAAITLMPGDFGTPIADKLADMSGWFLLILCAIYVEKFLVTVAGIVAFDLLIPIGFVLLAIGCFVEIPLRRAAARIIALGLVVFLLVPTTLGVSGLIRSRYAAEIQQTIDNANNNTDELRGTADRSDDDSIWTEFIAKIKGGSETLMKKLETLLGNFVDAIAVYIVTTCVIPVAVLLLGFWLIKTILHIDVSLPGRFRLSEYTTKRYRGAAERRRRQQDGPDLPDPPAGED